jgi:hypothetical protein
MRLLDEPIDMDTAVTQWRLRAVHPASLAQNTAPQSDAALPNGDEETQVPTPDEATLAAGGIGCRRLDPISRAIILDAAYAFWKPDPDDRTGETRPLPALHAQVRLESARERCIRQAAGNLVTACQTTAEMHAQEVAEMQAFIRRINDRMEFM